MKTKYLVAHVNLSRGYSSKERQVELLIQALAEFRIKQILICRDDSPMIRHLKNVKQLKAIRISGVSDPRYVGHLRLARKATVIHAHDLHGMRWALIHFMFFGVPYLITLRSSKYIDNSFFNRLMFSWSYKVIAVSSIIANAAKSIHGIECHVITDCCSHLVPYQRNVDKIKSLFKDRFIIGHIGPLVNRHKGQSSLIEAAKLLETQIPQIVVLFIGAGDDLQLLREKARGMPNIKFLGNISNAVDYIACMDVFASPSKDEALGNTPLDVMSLGVPIVATKVGAIPDIIKHEVTGLVVNPNDPKELADAILRLYKDSDLRTRIVANAKNEAIKHSPELMASEYLNYYHSLT